MRSNRISATIFRNDHMIVQTSAVESNVHQSAGRPATETAGARRTSPRLYGEVRVELPAAAIPNGIIPATTPDVDDELIPLGIMG